jgi:histidine triad (HIT) family protein
MGQGSAYRGWLVVEPKRHVPGLGELRDDEASALGLLSNQLARVLKQAMNASHVYAFVYGDGVPHLHVHLAPRYPNTPREFWGPKLTQWPDAPRVNAEQMRTLISRLREQL